MKTRDKILLASLTLFNDEGEGNVTTVDIANELDISPGNLYYHFHGKEQIILELYAGFELEMVDILEAPLEQSLDAQDAWFYLYIVFEQIFKHRYLYHNLNDILQRYPDIDRRFGRLLDLKRRAASAVAEELVSAGVMTASERQLAHLCDSVVLTLTYWLNYTGLRKDHAPNALSIHRGVFQLMSLVAPYLTDDFRYFYDECSALFDVLSCAD